MTLREALYTFFKLKDGHSLFAEIHARASGGVDVVIPNTPEAEVMVGHMDKNLTCFFKQFLMSKNVDENFIDELMERGICAATIHESMTCTWDPETWEVTTKEEKERDEDYKTIEQAAWYQDLFKQNEGKIRTTLTMPPQKPSTTLILNVLSRRYMKGTRGDMLKELTPSR